MKKWWSEFFIALTRGSAAFRPTYTGLDVRILISRNAKMTPNKAAAQAVHAALNAFGVDHGRVIVLDGTATQVQKMPIVIHDAGHTELAPGTLTAGARLEVRREPAGDH